MLPVSYVRQLPVRLYLELKKRAEPVDFTYTHMGHRTIQTSQGPTLDLPLRRLRTWLTGIKWGERQSWGRYAGFLLPYRRARRPVRTTILASFPADFAQPP